MAYGGVGISLNVYMIAEANYSTPPGPGQASAHVSAVGSITVNTTPRPVASINVTPYHVAYDGNAHTATGTATGADGADLSAGLNLTGTTHTNAGDYPSDAWSFAGGTNYNDASGTVHDIIDEAGKVSIWINDTPGNSDNITLFNPAPLAQAYTQTIPAQITNLGVTKVLVS